MFNIFLSVFFGTLAFAFVEPYFFIGYLVSIALFGLFQAIFMANAGGAWDNAKKIVEVELKQKGTPLHDATVVGDTVGDPFKDTSSVAMNPVIKFTTLFGLLAVELAVQRDGQQGATLTHILAAVFFAVSMFFVWRSFYGMRIGKANERRDRALMQASLSRGAYRGAWRQVTQDRRSTFAERCLMRGRRSLTPFFGSDYNPGLRSVGIGRATGADEPKHTQDDTGSSKGGSPCTDMFGDVVDPSSQGRDQAVVHGAAVDSGPRDRARRADRHSAARDGHDSDAAVRAGVRGHAAAAATAATSAAAAAAAPSTPQPMMDVIPNAAPIEAPKEIKPEPPAPPSYSMAGVVGGVAGGIPGGTSAASSAAFRAAAARAAAGAGARRRRHQGTEEASRTSSRSTRRSPDRQDPGHRHHRGDHRQGRPREGRQGPSVRCRMLDQAALEAVRQWRYTPTLLNGQPVEVVMTVTVTFTLNR